jgi:hypothetical protein
MKPLAACLGFLFSSVLAALLLGMVGSGLHLSSILASFAIGTVTAFFAWRGTMNLPATQSPRLWDGIMLTIFALVSLRAFLWLVYCRGDEICVLSPNNLGDMSLHLDFIRYLAGGVPFWPENPILAGVPLTYPLGADLFNSLLEISGVDTFRGLVWVGLAGAAMTGFALWRWGGAFGLAAFLFNGGLAGFTALRSLTITDFQSELIWKNLFLSMFVTQRGLLLALPAGFLLLLTWREKFFRTGKSPVPPWLQLLLYSAMPLFNAHAFLFLSVVLLAIFALRRPFRQELLVFAGIAFVPATVCVLLVTGLFSASSGLRFQPGWITKDSGWMAWIHNFGLALPLMLALGLMLVRDKDAEARCFVWTALAVFAICCVVIFAPWEWDNMKLMMWSWLVMAPYIWSKIIAPLKLPPRAAVCMLLFFSGAVSLCGGLDGRHGYGIARCSEVDAWQVAVADIPVTARFACVPDFNHPLILLGRKVACGYEGHLWSHGLPYREKLDLLRNALAGEESWPIAAPTLDVQWLALRNTDLPAAKPPGDFPTGKIGAIYDLSALPKPIEGNPEPPQLQPRSVGLSW